MCTDPGYDDRSEPPTGWTPPALGPACPLLGYADLHEHLLAHLAHGGTVTAGTPAPIDGDAGFTLDGGLSVKDALDPEDDESLHTDNHGLLLGDPIGKGLGDIATGTTGYPLYNHWPHWTSATHQQMYYKWLERAWRGGMRLMVQLAVTNEALCYINPRAEPRSTDCNNSMKLVNAQTEAAYDFERFIDEQSGQDFPDGRGWFRIVTSPQQARTVIAAGKLAVVLGIEMDKLFNCERSDPARICPDPSDFASLSEAVAQLHDDGIRYVFPIHDFDNAFGATADWSSAIDAGQGVATANPANEDGERNALYQAAENCPSVPGVGDYGFRLDEGTIEFILLAGFPGNVVPGAALLPQIPDYGDLETTCNPNGLTQPGLVLLRELMARGMIIDVDHMSRHAFYQTVGFGVQRYGPRGYPLVAGHVQSFELHTPDIRHERMRTPQQLALIRDSGGMIAAMTKDDVQDTGSALFGGHAGEHEFGPYPSLIGAEPRFGPRIEDSCRHSSRTFAQAYQYAVDVMEGPVALGPDFMGLAGHVGPRFGSEACGNIFRPNQPSIEEEKSKQIRLSEKLVYPFTLDGFGEFSRQQTNLRTFDFNDDGLAHVGLLPDLIADMKLVGLSDRYVDALFHSGEEYIRVWELAEARANGTDPPEPPEELSCPELCLGPELDETPPSITCTDFPIECTGPETLVFRSNFVQAGEDNCGGTVGTQCDDGSALYPVGATTRTCTATDDAGNESEPCEAVIAVTDSNSPSITAPADPPPVECTSASGASALLGVATASDLCDASPSVSDDAPSVFPLGTTTVTWTAMDGSANVSHAFQTVTVVDTTPPSNTCPGEATIECDEARDPSKTGSATATDTCDSAPEVASSDAEVAGACADESVITRTWSATDAAGNAAADCDQSIMVVDTTAPVIACNAPATVNPTRGLDEDEPLAAPISFTARAPDNCDPNATVEIVGFDCFAFTRTGRRIDKTADGCVTAIDGDTFTILDSGGVGNTITWTVRATDRCGEASETVCEVEVVNPDDIP
jgi:microsomal dipeptidase-like Zn-dependent dipeptidase